MMFAAYQTAPQRMRLRRVIPLVAEDAPTTWIHVAMPGTWKGHDAGEFTLTTDVFRQIIANFERQANPIPLDWEHATEYASQAPAAGWVQELALRGDDLWARVELGVKAASQIKAGEYRFSSGVFVFDATDRATGKDVGAVLHSLALTNVPFIDGQEPIRLRRWGRKGHSMGISIKAYMERLAALEDEEMEPEQLAKLAEAMGLEASAIAPPKDAPAPEAAAAPMSDDATAAADPTAPLDPEETGDAAAMIVAKLAEMLGTDEAGVLAAISENLDAVAAALAGAGAEAEAAPMSSEVHASTRAAQSMIVALTARAEKAEASLAKVARKEAEAEVDALVESGVILETGRAHMLEFRLSNREAYEGLVLSMRNRPAVPRGVVAGAGNGFDASTTPIDESDPVVVATRRTLSAMGKSREAQDKAIRKHFATNGAAR